MFEIFDAAGLKRLAIIPTNLLQDLKRTSFASGIKTLEFSMPADTAKFDYIVNENLVRFDGDEYLIKKPTVNIREDVTVSIDCHSTALRLAKILVREKLELSSIDIQSAIVMILEASNTDWVMGNLYGLIGQVRSFIVDKDTSVLDAINKALEAFGAVNEGITGPFVKFRTIDRRIDIYEDIGNDNGVQIRYRKNMLSLSMQTDSSSLITRLYPKGKDDITIAAVNPTGFEYVENYSYYEALGYNVADSAVRKRLLQEDTWNATDYDNTVYLYEDSVNKLAAMAWPKLTLNAQIADLYSLFGITAEKLNLGDWLAVIYDPVNDGVSVMTRTRLTKYVEYPNEPEKNGVEIGTPQKTIADVVKGSLQMVDKVQKSRSISGLLQGFIDLAATTINCTKGLMEIGDNYINFWATDANGVKTGSGMKLTPGGLGLTDDGGQTYDYAVTSDGILASKVIVNELWALATEDGFTKLMADGLKVFNETSQLRAAVGWWEDAQQTKHYGLRVLDETGTVALIDDRGIMQSWQEGRVDNVFMEKTLNLWVYVPPQTKEVKRCLLRFKMLPFRSYELNAASGGGIATTTAYGGDSYPTTASGGSTTRTSDAPYYHLSGYYLPADWMNYEGSHNHGISGGTRLALEGGGGVTFEQSGSHAHGRDTGHDHDVYIPSHTHGVTIPSHNHNVIIPSHTHGMEYGVYESTDLMPSRIAVFINGYDKSETLGGTWETDQSDLNIAPFINVGQWNSIQLGSLTLGRLDATVFIQAIMGV